VGFGAERTAVPSWALSGSLNSNFKARTALLLQAVIFALIHPWTARRGLEPFGQLGRVDHARIALACNVGTGDAGRPLGERSAAGGYRRLVRCCRWAVGALCRRPPLAERTGCPQTPTDREGHWLAGARLRLIWGAAAALGPLTHCLARGRFAFNRSSEGFSRGAGHRSRSSRSLTVRPKSWGLVSNAFSRGGPKSCPSFSGPEQLSGRPRHHAHRVVARLKHCPASKAYCSRCVWGCRPMKKMAGCHLIGSEDALELSVIGPPGLPIVIGPFINTLKRIIHRDCLPEIQLQARIRSFPEQTRSWLAQMRISATAPGCRR